MEDGTLEINSNEIMSAVSILDESLGVIEGLSGKIPGNFSVLSDIGLFPSLNKISAQITSISTSTKNLMSKITVHAQDFEALENRLEQMVTDASSTSTTDYSYSSSSDYSGEYEEIADIVVDSVNEGVKINTDDILDSISNLTDSDKIKLIEFLKLNDKKIEASELLFNPENAGLLLQLLKKFYGDTSNDLGEENISEATKVQKALLQKITSDTSNLIDQNVIEDNSLILKAKPYLISVANRNNITLTELIDDEKNNDIYLEAMADLYDGNGLEKCNIDNNTLSEIRSEMEKIASNNNMTVENIIGDSRYVSLLK